ncbi:hypothetical protein GFJ99_11690 [Flavobacterium sp. LMO6]|uniref:Uncharacterized protein n=1 Tax=Flavobacterium phage vB_FspS_laban6-1 TaxID=2686250 RepID=A0A6B9LGM1_9CAUD|nr:hypothetical protein [Flavobacterium sp. LMO6]YP_009854828.1 hypothetical protein HWC90_gp30 [Flavobacterium phage vB_FspS_laban6-1]MQP63357.1 hypothetical protein [Flavobacterium sp. LMO6]QHB39001.1 hypothetical protein laban61_gp030 [Flavobacterium phage vB_FspS_laban6-1]
MLINEVTLDDIYDFIQTGNPDNAPEHIVEYLELLTRVDGMIRRIDKFGSKNAVVKHIVLIEKLFGQKLSYYKASKIYSEAIEYFFSDAEVSKKAWGNFYANIIDQEINFARQIKKDGQDSKRIVDMAKVAAEIRGVFEEDKEELPDELFRKPFVVYSTKAEELGLPKVDRNRLKEMIDSKIPDLSEKEKLRIYQEADIVQFEVFPDVEKDPRKS